VVKAGGSFELGLTQCVALENEVEGRSDKLEDKYYLECNWTVETRLLFSTFHLILQHFMSIRLALLTYPIPYPANVGLVY
jgi:hypothetical protein